MTARNAHGGQSEHRSLGFLAAAAGLLVLLCGCVSRVYAPGPPESPFQQLRLGQTYGEMTKLAGEPDHSRVEDRMGEELVILFIPLWNLVECIWNFHPSSTQVYTYDRWGTVTIGDENRVLRVEGRP